MTTQPGAVRTIITAAVTILFVLGGLLAARLVLRWWQTSRLIVPPHLLVESPRETQVSGLEVPCWSCPSAGDWPIEFRTDLDLIAPLGNGPGNAADFFALFEKERGPRAGDAEALMSRRFETEGDFGLIVAGDDELLVEAEPWIDQASMSFYPEIFPMEGVDTRITNLLFVLTFARSWTARGVAAENPEEGLEDCRRAIRLGRLLRQEDVTVIQDLVGLACIHIGTRGVYGIAQNESDLELSLLASIVLGEVAPQRFMTMEKISALDLEPYMRWDSSGAYRLEMPDSFLETIVTRSETLTERRFFGEIILPCHVIAHLGTPEQQHRAGEILTRLAADEDPIIADLARWALDNPVTDGMVAGYYPHPSKR